MGVGFKECDSKVELNAEKRTLNFSSLWLNILSFLTDSAVNWSMIMHMTLE